jgi:hypothetical protein
LFAALLAAGSRLDMGFRQGFCNGAARRGLCGLALAARRGLCGLALAAAAGGAQASSIADLGLSLEQARALNAQLTAPIAAPGIAFGSPTAYGAGWGQTFAGIGGQTIDEPNSDVDGSALLGFGVGDPNRYLGFEAAMNIISLTNSFGDAGSWGFKVHHTFADRSALAVGLADVGGWGDANETNTTTFVAYSRAMDLEPANPKRPLTLAWNVGLGNESLAEPDADLGVFGSVALSWHRQSSVIADYNGRDLGLAVSAVPFYRIPLVVTAGFINVTGRYEDLQFAGGVGYLHNF